MGLPEILGDDSNIHAIATVIAPERPNLGLALAAGCVKAWREAEVATRTIMWLSERGVDDAHIARRIIAILGERAVESLEANPYVLVPLLPWSKVDDLGLKLLAEANVSLPRRDARRLVGAVDAAVRTAIIDGHTAIRGDQLRQLIGRHLRVHADSTIVAEAIDQGVVNGAIIGAGDIWRAPGCASMEEDLVARLSRMQAPDYPCPVVVPSPEELLGRLQTMLIGGHRMHPEQIAACMKLILIPLACLQGGAGVGKTTTTQAIADLWASLGGRLVLCCIAGKAALRLSRSTHRLAVTLARLLHQLDERERIEKSLTDASLDDNARRDAEQRLSELAELTPTTLIVIDEASMVDLATAHALVRRMPDGARLLFVGDEAQLPPVGFGLVYHALVTDTHITARLMIVHRQTEASGIPAVAWAVREGNVPLLPPYAGSAEGVSFLQCSSQELQEKVRIVWKELGGHETNPLIVTPTYAGNAGLDKLNKLLQQAHAEDSDLPTIKGCLGHWYCAGDPVVWLRNDYGRSLFNGLLGRVQDVDPETRSVRVLFDGFDEPHEIATEQLIDLALAYAITCHRAQGSQARAVIIPLCSSRMMDPTWLYTAITRAERQVVLVGDREVLIDALSRPWAVQQRQVGITWQCPAPHSPLTQVPNRAFAVREAIDLV